MTDMETYPSLARFMGALRAICNLDPDKVFDFCMENTIDPGRIEDLRRNPADWFATLPDASRAQIWDRMIHPLLPEIGSVRLAMTVHHDGTISVISATAHLPGAAGVVNLVPEP